VSKEIELVQLPCKVCGLPVDVTKKKAEEYKKANELPLCLQHAIEKNPEKF
jgi:hypothetical protein